MKKASNRPTKGESFNLTLPADLVRRGKVAAEKSGQNWNEFVIGAAREKMEKTLGPTERKVEVELREYAAQRAAMAGTIEVHVEAVSSPDAVEPNLFIKELRPLLDVMHVSCQRMNVEITLPAHLWLMLVEIDGIEKIGDTVSEILFNSPQLRAQWLKKYAWEREVLPEVLKELDDLRPNA